MAAKATNSARDTVRHLRTAAQPADDDAQEKPDKRKGGPSPQPVDCPVIPLGKEGRCYHYLDDNQQFITLTDWDHQRLPLMALFGNQPEYLYKTWPRTSIDKETGQPWTSGWKPELCAEWLMRTAAGRLWSPSERVRGTGAWRGADGGLILHCGDRIWIGAGQAGHWRSPGVIDPLVYPAYPPVQKPAERPQPAGDGGPAHEVLSLLKSWTWRRGETDAMLLLGWIGAAKIGGALHWRPNMWITGGKNTGKSTLQQVIGGLMGDGGLLQSSDATAAAIRQTLGYCSLPVALDEAEEDNRGINALVKIARDGGAGPPEDPQRPPIHPARLHPVPVDPDAAADGAGPLAPGDPGTGAAERRRGRRTFPPKSWMPWGGRCCGGWWMAGRGCPRCWRCIARRWSNMATRGAASMCSAPCWPLRTSCGTIPCPPGTNWPCGVHADTLPELEGDIADEHYCLSHLMSQVIDPYRSGGRWRNGLARPPGGTTPSGRTRKKGRQAAS
ncbi:MAG: DNA primase [bacterium]|nr:MAG: DNA primase [bacterium]